MLKRILPLLIVGFFSSAYFIQSFKDDYTPLKDFSASSDFIKKISNSFDSMRTENSYSIKQNKDIKEVLKESKKALISLDTAKLLMRNDTITRYLQALTDKIQQKNSLLNGKKFTIFTYRTNEPNAANWGAGVILYNLDLLSKYSLEEEVCITLCHEISHDLRKHVIHSLEEKYAILNSEEYKKELKSIKQSEYGRFKQIEALLAKFMARDSKSNRTKELEADSLGLVLYCNAGYSAYYAIQEMEKLDSIDNHIVFNKIDYIKQFNFPNYSFKKSWLEQDTEEETIKGSNIARELPDSLKTHPDCKIRLQALKRIAKKMNYNLNKPVHTGSTFDYYRMVSLFEELEYNQAEGFDIGEALYGALQLNTLYPNNAFLKCSIVNSLYEVYISKVDHYMSTIVDFPRDTRTPEYNQLLIFLHNVNSDVIKNIMINYYQSNVADKIDTPYGGYIATLIKSVDMTKKDKEKLINEYKKKYNDAHYTKLLTSKFKPKKT